DPVPAAARLRRLRHPGAAGARPRHQGPHPREVDGQAAGPGARRAGPERAPAVAAGAAARHRQPLRRERSIDAGMTPYGPGWEEELGLLLEALPPRVSGATQRLSADHGDLLEVVLDLGREPEARFTDGDAVLDSLQVTRDDLEYVAQRVGDFGDDNRAGIE